MDSGAAAHSGALSCWFQPHQFRFFSKKTSTKKSGEVGNLHATICNQLLFRKRYATFNLCFPMFSSWGSLNPMFLLCVSKATVGSQVHNWGEPLTSSLQNLQRQYQIISNAKSIKGYLRALRTLATPKPELLAPGQSL